MYWKIVSETWGQLEASHAEVTGPFVTLRNVKRNGEPFYRECMVPVGDVRLIVPPEA